MMRKISRLKMQLNFARKTNVKVKKALSTGNFPLIRDHKTITRRLTGEVVHGSEKSGVPILLPSEKKA